MDNIHASISAALGQGFTSTVEVPKDAQVILAATGSAADKAP